MPKIETVYICNHTHTDIGFTDYQDVCFRQHKEFIDQALDLIEETSELSQAAQYKWTCETTGPLLRYLRTAPDAQVERFRRWHRAGRIDMAGMQYNFTPLLNTEQMIRSLYPLRSLRDEYGLTVEAAMQDDVNGVSWLFADLLPAAGIRFYTAAVNPIRGARPKPFPGAFWWEGPGGGRVLAWNGFYYLFGRSQAGLGNWDLVDRFLPRWVQQLEQDDDYQYDFLYCGSTHPIRVDNGPPDPRMPPFVERWNAEGRTPRLAFITVTDFGRMLHERYGDRLGVQRGDWTDHWTDGAASSAYETGLNRTTHELMLVGESLQAWLSADGDATWDADRWAHIYEQATLYDEHTWGAYSSIEAPFSLFTKAHWSRKSNFAYTAAMEAHDVLARAAERLAARVAAPPPEGNFNLGELSPQETIPPSGVDELLVVNTLPWERTVIVEEPEARGSAAPAGMIDMFFNRGTGWGGVRDITPTRRVAGRVPAFGYTFVSLHDTPAADDLAFAEHTIENAHYRVRIGPDTGAIVEFFDKDLEHDFAGRYRDLGIGQYLYEQVDGPEGRLAIANIDFAHPDFFVGQRDTPWVPRTASKVTVGTPVVQHGRASIEVRVEAAGLEYGVCRFDVETRTKALSVDWTLYKRHVTDPEAVFVAFPFNLGEPRFMLDLNGVPSRPNDDQLDGAAKDWYPVQRWIGASDGTKGVTVVPLDAPLMQIGGMTTGRWARTLEPEGPTLMSWALNNHWLVNFKASQGGEIPLRYRLTTHAGDIDPRAAGRFAAEVRSPAMVLRDRRPTGSRQGQFLRLEAASTTLLSAKPAEDGDGIVLRLQNQTSTRETARLVFLSAAPTSACLTSPIEVDGRSLPLDGGAVQVPVERLGVQSFRVRFTP